jgi:DNA-binding transcriptional regulator/RsmH inhibitor MraZ
MPAWLNEGLAEQMETLEYDDSGRFVIHQHTLNHRQIAAQQQLMPVREFVEINNVTWRQQNLNQAIHQAMAGQPVS